VRKGVGDYATPILRKGGRWLTGCPGVGSCHADNQLPTAAKRQNQPFATICLANRQHSEDDRTHHRIYTSRSDRASARLGALEPSKGKC